MNGKVTKHLRKLAQILTVHHTDGYRYTGEPSKRTGQRKIEMTAMSTRRVLKRIERLYIAGTLPGHDGRSTPEITPALIAKLLSCEGIIERPPAPLGGGRKDS